MGDDKGVVCIQSGEQDAESQQRKRENFALWGYDDDVVGAKHG